MELVVQLVVMAVFGVACALIAQSRGRSPVGWFFIGLLAGCIGLIILLVIPDLKVQEERERRLVAENRRLRERLRKDRMVADQRHEQVSRRIGAHDVALGIDTATESYGELPGSVPPIDPGPAQELKGSAWYWAHGLNRKGPVDFGTLRQRWMDGEVTTETLVWRKGMANWTAVGDVPHLEDALDG